MSDAISIQLELWHELGRKRQGGFNWPKEKWIENFPFTSAEFALLPNELDRQVTKDGVQILLQSGKFLTAYILTMAWGYGDRGYGRFRTAKTLKNAGFEDLLQEAGEACMAGEPIRAIEVFAKYAPKGIKMAFATKYLYFASAGSSREALILDSTLADFFYRKYDLKFELMKFDSRNYEHYLGVMERSAEKYNLPAGDFEEILFSTLDPTWIGNRNP